MGTGMQRLKDKHANKKQKVVQIRDKAIEKMDKEENTPESIAAKKAKTHVYAPNMGLNTEEMLYFTDIWTKLKLIYPDPEKYRLSAINLAKLYAWGKRFEAEIEKDGGPIIENAKGDLVAHPAMRLLQSNHKMITANLAQLGISAPRPKAEKEDKDEPFTSDFAQFS